MSHYHLEASLLDRPLVVAFERLEDARAAYDRCTAPGAAEASPRVLACAGCDRLAVTEAQANPTGTE